MSWEIQIPYRDRSESLIDVVSNCRHLDDDRDVAQRVVIQAQLDGLTTAGELIDYVEALEPHERRQLLDKARAAAGLESTEMVDAARRIEIASNAAAARASEYNGVQLCHGRTPDGHSCNAIPMTDYGVPRRVDCRRWFCPEHRSQATVEDLSPIPSPWRRAPSGAIVEVDPIELAREQALAESRRHQLEAAAAEREHEVAELHALERARREQHERELPEHLRGGLA